MKLTKEECVFALAGLYSAADGEHDEENKDVLQQLIDEHFLMKEQLVAYFGGRGCMKTTVVENRMLRNINPPLKFEELKEGMWVWDNKYKDYVRLKLHDIENYGKLIIFSKDYGVEYLRKFEENRFYLREVKE